LEPDSRLIGVVTASIATRAQLESTDQLPLGIRIFTIL